MFVSPITIILIAITMDLSEGAFASDSIHCPLEIENEELMKSSNIF